MATDGHSELDRAVVQIVETRPEILAVWMFGSRARGEARASSDLDLAILERVGSKLDGDALGRLILALEQATGLHVDLALLDGHAPVLAYEVLATGRRLFCREPESVDVLEESWLSEYLDTEHLRRVQRALRSEGSA